LNGHIEGVADDIHLFNEKRREWELQLRPSPYWRSTG
jgi:hypothetical protein